MTIESVNSNQTDIMRLVLPISALKGGNELKQRWRGLVARIFWRVENVDAIFVTSIHFANLMVDQV